MVNHASASTAGLFELAPAVACACASYSATCWLPPARPQLFYSFASDDGDIPLPLPAADMPDDDGDVFYECFSVSLHLLICGLHRALAACFAAAPHARRQ